MELAEIKKMVSDLKAQSSPNLELEKYKLDRAHEVELNKFAHVLSVERLKILSWLNGSAAAIYITFLQGSLKSLPAPGDLEKLIFGNCSPGVQAAGMTD